MTIPSHVQRVFDRLDVDERVKVAPDLGNIDSPTGGEGPVGARTCTTGSLGRE